ncbi:MAG: nicotinate phosphoribosyltransferase [Armatimonadota bacterium]|nr:nicotinate phosphoribosyltransferase [Armatimonadota bacterium]
MDDRGMGFVSEQTMAMLVDLYELTMAQSYFREGRNETATFDLFIRPLPARNFLVSAGLESVLVYLERMRFPEEGLAYLERLGLFDRAFLDHLRALRFTGNVRAIPEGEIFFATEPVLEVTAPRIQAQIVETFLLNQINCQVTVASKAARVALAAQGRPVIEMSPRRTHGTDAAMKAARSAYLAGCAGTSNVLAGMTYGIPIYGTMAHSYVMSFDDELTAFRTYARHFPDNCVLLIDTYDTVQGARQAAIVAGELRERGHRLRAVRIDSGDIADLSRRVRAVLDEAGFPEVQILASGDLNEHRIRALLADGAPIDAFGVGTEIGVPSDAPTLGGVYKLVEDESGFRIKRSAGKITLPGRKQVWRVLSGGRWVEDVIALDEEPTPPNGTPLLVEVMRDGRRLASETLVQARERCLSRLRELPAPLLVPDGGTHPVRRSPGLDAVFHSMASAASL